MPRNDAILGNTSVSFDCLAAASTIFGDLNIYACSYGKGSVSGDATVTFSGDGNNLDFSGYVVGDSSAATTMISFVEGSSSLVFDRFTGNFNAVSIAGFDRIVISGSSVRWTAMERNLSDVTDWEFELGDPSRASLTADLFAGNDFSGDTIRLTFEEEAISGSGWTVIDAGDARLVHESGGRLRMVQRRRGRVEGGRLVRRRIQAFRRGR